MNNATVVTETLTDDSKAHNVAFRDDAGKLIATIAAEDRGHADRIANAINGASWIQFH